MCYYVHNIVWFSAIIEQGKEQWNEEEHLSVINNVHWLIKEHSKIKVNACSMCALCQLVYFSKANLLQVIIVGYSIQRLLPATVLLNFILSSVCVVYRRL